MPLILILLLAVFQCSITNYLIANPDYYQLGPYSWESDDFRAMSLGDAVAGLDNLDPDMVATLMVEHDYDLTGLKDTRYNNRLLAAARPADYRKLKHAYETVLGDLEYFPIPESRNKDTPDGRAGICKRRGERRRGQQQRERWPEKQPKTPP